ncbi:MAG: PBP1A family penicillin-binding protein [Verrucomicrobiota bacterium]|nr:PBP1A family penicillin-binding protein [Verrucomicrobiota bacterium]
MPVSYLTRATRDHYDRGLWRKPEFYVPVGGVLVLLLGGLCYAFYLAAAMSAEADTFDLAKLEQMESASVIVDRNDKIFGQIYVENRETVPYDQLPRNLVNGVVAIEDNKFYQHSGYDLGGIFRAALKNFTSGHVRQGASTVTQQLARNSFALKERTFKRKLLEVFLSRRIEQRFGKQKIMELYLNRIYFGGGLYGAEAASRGYFGKPAREMTLTESATLAGLIKSPNRLSPWGDRVASREARNVVLGRMRDLGFITAEKCASAQNEDVVIGNRQSAQGQTYAVDYVRQQVIAAVGWDRAMNEGFRIHTTIDAELQKVAEESLRTHLDQAEQHAGYNHPTYADYAARFKNAKKVAAPNASAAPDYLQGAVIALDNQSGGILALVGGRDFEHNQFDRALQARRPPGTAMKPFVYAAAFEKGMYPGSVVEDSALDNRAVMIGGTTGILGEWGPEREDNRYEGPITARAALAKSKNGATVRVGMNAGVDSVIQLCKNAGIRSPLRQYPATFLGSSEITLAELALAYTIFPNGGSRADAPHILDRIEEKDGSIVWQAPEAKSRQTAIKPETAYEVHSCLVDALQTGTGRAARETLGLKDIPAAGKTGTAYDFTDAIFAGYDSALTCAVWAGFDKPQKIYRGAFGSEIALPVWVDIMNASVARYVPKELARPAGVHDVEICSRSGLLATDKCVETVKGVERRTTYRELATDAQMPTEPCNVHGESRGRLVHDLPTSGVPRAALAVDVSEVSPVSIKGPTLLAENDPYGSVKSTVKPKPVPEKPKPEPAQLATTTTTPVVPETSAEKAGADMPDPSKPVLRAQPVERASSTPTPSEPARARSLQSDENAGPRDVFRPRRAQPTPLTATPLPRAAESPVQIRRAQAVRPEDRVPSDSFLTAPAPTPTPEDE